MHTSIGIKRSIIPVRRHMTLKLKPSALYDQVNVMKKSGTYEPINAVWPPDSGARSLNFACK